MWLVVTATGPAMPLGIDSELSERFRELLNPGAISTCDAQSFADMDPTKARRIKNSWGSKTQIKRIEAALGRHASPVLERLRAADRRDSSLVGAGAASGGFTSRRVSEMDTPSDTPTFLNRKTANSSPRPTMSWATGRSLEPEEEAPDWQRRNDQQAPRSETGWNCHPNVNSTDGVRGRILWIDSKPNGS